MKTLALAKENMYLVSEVKTLEAVAIPNVKPSPEKICVAKQFIKKLL